MLRMFSIACLSLLMVGSAHAEDDSVWQYFKFREAAKVSTPTAPSRKTAAPHQHHAVKSLVTDVAKAHGVDPRIAHSIVKIESSYNCSARNGVHHGIMQTNVRTARGVGVNGNLFDCRNGLEAGMRYLKQAIDAYGPGCAGISAYNTGIYKTGRCTAYGRKVLALSN